MYLHLKKTSLVFLQGVEQLWRAASAESASADCQSKPLDLSPAHSLQPARMQINNTAHFICIYALDKCGLKETYKIKCKIPAILVCLPWADKLTEFNIFNQARHARYGYLILAPSIKIVSRILLIVACRLFYRKLCKTVKQKLIHSFLILCGGCRPRSGCNTLAPL